MVGKTISHYEITGKLGEGGMGVVYKARDTHLNRAVALKFLHPEEVKLEEYKSRFLHEARAAAALDHPNICTVYEIGETDGIAFLVMAYVEGESLAERIRKRPLPVEEALEITIQLAKGLDAAHRKGIVHRDIKPANIMIDLERRVEITDFGLAHLADGTKITRTGSSMGTAAYMSPEQVRGGAVDHRTDIWACGVVLYEMIAGRLPFKGERSGAVSHSILYEEPEPLTAVRSGVPILLDQLVGKTLRKNVEERYQHIDELSVDLRALLEKLETGVSRTTTAKRRPALPWFVVGALLAAMAGVTGWYLTRRAAAPERPLTAVPLTSYPGIEDHATFSPEGDRVAFHWCPEGGNCDVYVKLIGSETTQRLTDDPRPDYHPAWSPDGREIAFFRNTSGDARAVMLIPSIGGSARVLAEVPRRETGFIESGPAWHPGGKWLALSTRGGPDETYGIFLISRETGEKRRLTSPPHTVQGDGAPACSPDGHSLAFHRFAQWGAADLYLLDLTDDLRPAGAPRQFTATQGMEITPAWSADGKGIVYAGLQTAGEFMLWRAPVNAPGSATRLDFAGSGSQYPTVSASRDRLAYTSLREDENIWRLDLASPGRAAHPPERHISSSQVDGGPAYSPNGSRIAFVSGRSGTREIWISNRDGSDPQRLTFLNGPGVADPCWAPDGERIVHAAVIEGQREIFIVSLRGGQAQRLTDHSADDGNPTWSRDGKWIYFVSNRSGSGRVWKVPSVGGQAIQVTQNGGGMAIESYDRTFLYYPTDVSGGALWRIPVAGGEASTVLDSLYRNTNFTVARDGIYFIFRSAANEGFSIQFYSFASKKTSLVTALDRAPAWGMDIAPDGRSLLYAQNDAGTRDLMLVDGFR